MVQLPGCRAELESFCWALWLYLICWSVLVHSLATNWLFWPPFFVLQFLFSSIWTFLQSIHINIGLNLAGPLLLPIGRGFAPAHCYCESFGDWGVVGTKGGWGGCEGGCEGGGAMLCVMGEECQYLAVKYRVEEIMFLPHEAFHYFKLPLQSRLKDPSSSSPDKSSSNDGRDERFNRSYNWN